MLRFSLDLIAAARALQSVFPDAGPVAALAVLGEGFGSLVVETPTGSVFRIARTPESGARYAREFQLLPLLRPYLPVAIPAPRWYLPASEIFPYGVIGYHRLPGRPLDSDDLRDPALHSAYAEQMALILAQLHRVPAQPFGLEDQWPHLYRSWLGQRDMAMPELKARLTGEEFRRVESWWEQFLVDDRLRTYSPAVIHGDFWFGNLLIEGNRITGLLDFENLALGDPVADFVPLLYLGEGWMRRVLAAYRQAGGIIDAGFDHRLEQLWAVREFSGLAYAVTYRDREEFEDGLIKLRRGPILSEAGLDGWGSGN